MFLKANRWKKKGISVIPIRYAVPWAGQNYGINVAVYSQDGTVAISHGGVEVGQGINTKVHLLINLDVNSCLTLNYELGLKLLITLPFKGCDFYFEVKLCILFYKYAIGPQ